VEGDRAEAGMCAAAYSSPGFQRDHRSVPRIDIGHIGRVLPPDVLRKAGVFDSGVTKVLAVDGGAGLGRQLSDCLPNLVHLLYQTDVHY